MKRAHDYTELDLFSECGENQVTEKVLWDEFPCSDVLTNDPTELNFTLRAAGDRSMIDLSRSQLYVKAKITNKDGSALSDNKTVGPVNNFLHSMFEDCATFLDDVEVTNANKLYPYNSYFLDLFETTTEAKESYMTAQLWYKNGAFNNTDPEQNPGFKKRAEKFGTRECGMIGKLHSELFHQDRYLLSGVEVKVKLTLGKPGFFFMSGAKKEDNKTPVDNDTYKLKITDAKMYVPYVHLTEKAKEDIENELKKKPAVYPIQRIVSKVIPINAQTEEHPLENISKGQLPNKILASLVRTKAKQQDITQSPFFFGTYKVKKIELNVDGMPYSKRALTPDPDKWAYAKTYMNVFESLNYTEEGANTPVISRDDFGTGFAIYPFNLNPGCASDPGMLKKSGNVSLFLEFEETVDVTDLQLVVMCIYDNCIKIDKDRNFTKDW